jgi:hypothetical protein
MTHEAPIGPHADPSTKSPRAESSEPSPNQSLISPPAEDLDTAHKQKRPRLDSGSKSIHSLSADPTLPSPLPLDSAVAMDSDSTTQNSPNRPSSRITLHVRPQPSKAVDPTVDPPSTDRRDSPASAPESPPQHRPEDRAIRHSIESDASDVVTNGAKTPLSDSSVQMNSATSPIDITSSPGVPIEIADPEDIGATPTIETITIEGEDDDLVEQFIYNFPYRSGTQTPIKAAQIVLQHLESDSDVEKDLLGHFHRWLRNLDVCFSSIAQRRYYDELFYHHYDLWVVLGTIFVRLFSKS